MCIVWLLLLVVVANLFVIATLYVCAGMGLDGHVKKFNGSNNLVVRAYMSPLPKKACFSFSHDRGIAASSLDKGVRIVCPGGSKNPSEPIGQGWILGTDHACSRYMKHSYSSE